MAALLVAAALGALGGIAVQGGPAAPAFPAPPPVATATIARTDLRSTILTTAVLGYASADPIVDQLTGTYTQLPAVGATIKPGATLYRVDNGPVTLMSGNTPAWRAFALGISDGPDVGQLQANLIAFGDATGLFTAPDGHYGWLTVAAVERWQRAELQPVTGEIQFGQVVFLPEPVRVGAHNTALGDAATPGQSPYEATSTARAVRVPLTPTLPPTHIGERISIILPSGQRTPGTITQIGSATGGGGGSAAITVAPTHSAATGSATDVAVQVSLTTQAARGVLAAPIPALLALEGGGYGVEVVESSGVHRLVGVQTGTYTGSQVQVSGHGIAAGVRVVIAQ